MFATSDIRVAISNDGHIPLPPWVPLVAIAVVVLSGAATIVVLVRNRRWKRKPKCPPV
jgi:hypothetical protein